jgi:hypothetical protein
MRLAEHGSFLFFCVGASPALDYISAGSWDRSPRGPPAGGRVFLWERLVWGHAWEAAIPPCEGSNG